MKRSFWIVVYSIIYFSAFSFQSGGIKGKITDKNGQGLPFATVHVSGTSFGTVTNSEGNYLLKLESGKYDLKFRFVGYVSADASIDINGDIKTYNVKLIPHAFELAEVIIMASREDPAYRVIRNAIANKDKYLNEIESFSCDVYIKGLQRLDEAPKSLLGIKINIDTGIVYLSESVSRLSFQRPDKYKERMISSKVSGKNNAFSYNQASDMKVNFYKNVVMAEVNQRGFISPIAKSAFLFYDYRLEGTYTENEYLVNKIKVIPLRKNDPSFNGYIYIIEDSWRIYSVDLILTKANQVEFIDSLSVNQLYAPVDHDRWIILFQSFKFQFKVFGFKGGGYFVGILSNYEIVPNFDKKYFTNEVIHVKEESNKKDSTYWALIRPIPLTVEEEFDYHIKDSLQFVKESKPYMDSVDHENNKISIGNIFLAGYTVRNSYKKKSYTINSLLDAVQYNTVEGLVTNLELQYRKSFDDRRFFRITPQTRYGFSNKRLNLQLEGIYYYHPKKFASWGVSLGRFVQQFNEDRPITVPVNTHYTLFRERNYMKIYEKEYLKIRHRKEPFNGFLFTGTIEWARRRQLENTTDYKFAGDGERTFTPNVPLNNNLADASFATHEALIIDFTTRIRFGQKYHSRPNQKINLGSKYPTIYLNYKKGINGFFGSDIDFDFVSIRINDDKQFGLLGKSNFLIETGTFLNHRKTVFIDYQHFKGNLTSIGDFSTGNFQLLDYYARSTLNSYFKAHFEHHFNGFIFNKMPLIKKLKTQAVFTTNYLSTKDDGNYWEIGAGIEHILKFLRIDYFTSFGDSVQTRNGFVFGVGF